MRNSKIDYVVTNKLVGKNLATLFSAIKKSSRTVLEDRAEYLFLIDKKSGHFAPIDQFHGKKEWVPVTIHFSRRTFFDAKTVCPFKHKLYASNKNLSDDAQFVFDETLSHLNRICRKLSHQWDSAMAIEEIEKEFRTRLSGIALTTKKLNMRDKALLNLCQKRLKEERAEAILHEQAYGAFILSKDAHDKLFEKREGLVALTVHYASETPDHLNEHIIRSKMVVRDEKGWTLYNDNIALDGKHYRYLSELLTSLGATHIVNAA